MSSLERSNQLKEFDLAQIERRHALHASRRVEGPFIQWRTGDASERVRVDNGESC